MGALRTFALCGLGLVSVLAGCGPSFQAVYECDVHFEHCYALDEGGAPAAAKKECWRDWLHGFTYGQSRDRIEYGGTRYSQLSLDQTLPSEEGASTPSRRKVAAPVPTNAFAPPPNLLDGHAGDARPADGHDAPHEVHGALLSGEVAQVAARAPGADCATECQQTWNVCRGSCKDSACARCDESYRGCMPNCFHEDGGAPPPPAVRTRR